ncbi:MAG TPA: hypothetical protein VMG36_03465 [Thermoplasmata archaeon]|nr:hypothetical protein [Thermoplasmata archaeon]
MDAGFVLWPVALAMAAIVAALVRWSAMTRTYVAAAVDVFLLGMMGAMLAAVAIYFSAPSADSLVVGIWVAAALMALSVFPVFALFLREAQRAAVAGATYRPGTVRSPGQFALVVAGVVLGAELLMGRGFSLANGTATRGLALVPLFGTTVADPFFLFPMAAEMTLSLLWLRHRLPRDARVILASQAAMMLFAPPALASGTWAVASAVVSAGAMTAAIAVVVRSAYVGREMARGERALVIGYLLATAAAAGGLAAWALGRGVGLFSLGMVAEMVLFFGAVVAPERLAVASAGNSPAPVPADAVAPPA